VGVYSGTAGGGTASELAVPRAAAREARRKAPRGKGCRRGWYCGGVLRRGQSVGVYNGYRCLGRRLPKRVVPRAAAPDSSDCQPLAFVSDPANTVPPFAVTHPPSYDGSGGVISIDVCVLPGSEIFRGPAMRAIQTWNALLATTQNCKNCRVCSHKRRSRPVSLRMTLT